MKFFSQFVEGRFVLVIVSFALQKLCSFMRSHLVILVLSTKPLVFCSGKFPLSPCVQDLSPLSPLKTSVCLLFCFVLVWFLVFRERVSLCSLDCPGTHSVDQAGLKLRNLPASASQVLGLKECATKAQPVCLVLRVGP